MDLFFIDGGANPPAPEAEIWDIAADGRMRITSFCHLDDFADTYRVLNTERPVHFAWLAESDGESPLISWDVRSGREPVGEGPADADAAKKKKWVPHNRTPPPNWRP